MLSLLFLLVLVAIAVGLLLLVYWGGRWWGSLAGALLMSVPTYVCVGSALAGHINPHATRFQPYPFTSVHDDVGNVVFWGVVWAVTLFFVLPKLGQRWRSKSRSLPEV